MSTATTRFKLSSVPASLTRQIQQLANTSLQDPTLHLLTATRAEMNTEIARKICQTGNCASRTSLPRPRWELHFLSVDGRRFKLPASEVTQSTGSHQCPTWTYASSEPLPSQGNRDEGEVKTVTVTLEMTPGQLKETFKSTANPNNKPTWGPYADEEQTVASTGEVPSEGEVPLASVWIASA